MSSCSASGFASEPGPWRPRLSLGLFRSSSGSSSTPTFPGPTRSRSRRSTATASLDIVALGGRTCAWYENPTWKKRIITTPKQTPGIISTATADLDDDGKAEIAIAYEFQMNQPAKGKLLLAHPGATFDDPWSLVPVADVPSIHRIRWAETRYPNPVYGVPRDSVTPFNADRDREILDRRPDLRPSATPPIFAEEPAHLVMFSVYLPKNEGREHHFIPYGGFIGGRGGNANFPGDRVVGGLGGGIGDPMPELSIARDCERMC